MQAALHQHTRAAQFYRLAGFVVNRFEIENVSFARQFALQRPVESAKRTVLGTKVSVINVAVNDVGNHALRMQLFPHRIGFHTYSNEIVRLEHLKGLWLSDGHERS